LDYITANNMQAPGALRSGSGGCGGELADVRHRGDPSPKWTKSVAVSQAASLAGWGLGGFVTRMNPPSSKKRIHARQQKAGSAMHTSKVARAHCLVAARLAASGLRVLAADADAPVVAEAAVGADLLQPLEVLAELGAEVVREGLRVLARLVVLLPVEEPGRDLELLRVLDDGHKLLDLILGELASALVRVNLSLLADEVGEAAANTTNGGEREHHLTAAIDVGIKNTQDVLEVWRDDERR